MVRSQKDAKASIRSPTKSLTSVKKKSKYNKGILTFKKEILKRLRRKVQTVETY